VRDLDRQLNTFDSVHERANFLQHLLAETENSISSMKSSETPTKSSSTNTSANDSGHVTGSKNGNNSQTEEDEDDEEGDEDEPGSMAELYAMLTDAGRAKNVAQKVCPHCTLLSPFFFLSTLRTRASTRPRQRTKEGRSSARYWLALGEPRTLRKRFFSIFLLLSPFFSALRSTNNSINESGYVKYNNINEPGSM
jgi:hypothetical protein